ncbi:MAG: hypothetical protein HKN26_06080 [Acidimicrobiales bacterium]|nr:hypothetical protein [Acidimicrobiales bacterium]
MQNFPTSRATLPRVRRVTIALFATIGLLSTMTTGASPASAEPIADMTTPALYNGTIIDMAADWEDAEACLVRPDVLDMPECFDSVEQLEARSAELIDEHGPVRGFSTRRGKSSFANCATKLWLYDGAYGTGAKINFQLRNQWINLSSYGFNQKTSSYHIGGCNATFHDYANGGGGLYPTNQTQAWDGSPGMAAGWNNDVSSVRIY